jgi:hypothetical protein
MGTDEQRRMSRHVAKAFTAEEWKKLSTYREFTDAVARAESNSEADGLIALGARLLNKDGAPRKPRSSPEK